VAVGAKLWLVRPLGFRVDDYYLRRAGLDYWEHLEWEVVDDWTTLCQRLAEESPGKEPWLFTKTATRLYTSMAFSPGDILVFDGIFLHRPELRAYWDYSVFLEVAFAVSIPRGAQRGESSPDPEAATNRRYVLGQELYLRTCEPARFATVTVNNDDLLAPYIVMPSAASTSDPSRPGGRTP
jgi:hypothetical protein